MSKDLLWRIGEQYVGELLDPATIRHPIDEVRRWVKVAIDGGIPTPNAMTLATCTGSVPAARIVLLKEIDDRGLVFYTNYTSRKGQELEANPTAALVLYWEPLHRQIRVLGHVERVTDGESDAYFASRPRGSQLGAIASEQSQDLENRADLEARVRELDANYAGVTPPRPAYWGGYRVLPSTIEFWQGQPSRLHDRLFYVRRGDGWICSRLQP